MAVPLLSGGLAGLAGLSGPWRRLWGFLWLQGAMAWAAWAGRRRLGAGWEVGRLRQFWVGLCGGPVLVAVQLACTLAVLQLAAWAGFGEWAARQALREQNQLAGLILQATPAWRAVWAVLLLAVAPVCEELFFRGFVHQALRRHGGMGPVAAALLSGAAFAWLHGYVVYFPGLWACGVLLGLAYELGRGPAVAVGAHSAFNALGLAAILRGWLTGAS